MGKILNRLSISQPSRTIETTTTRMAMVSPKFNRLREGSKRLATSPRMLRVAKPKTSTHKMLYTSPFLSRSSNKRTNRNWNRKPDSSHDAGTGIDVSSAVRDKGMGAVSGRQQRNNVTASPRETILPFSGREVSGIWRDSRSLDKGDTLVVTRDAMLRKSLEDAWRDGKTPRSRPS